MKVLGIIPARCASTRFPGKPLADIKGKPMIQWVYEAAIRSKLDDVIVATDDQRIYETSEAFGARAIMTTDCETGTERVYEVSTLFPEYDYYVNVQGDEPMLEPEDINLLISSLSPNNGIYTLVNDLGGFEALDRNTVKAFKNNFGEIECFTRSPIYSGYPYTFFRHIGIYAFPKHLMGIVKEEQTKNAIEEKLEQLSWMDKGIPLQGIYTKNKHDGIDTPEDLENLLKRLK